MTKFYSQRDAIGEALLELGSEFKKLVVLSPDVGKSTKALEFKNRYPERYFCTGISEQNTTGVASGLAAMGWTALVAGYAMFVAGKTWEPIRNSVCYPGMDVKIIATHGGINVGADGVTHQSIEDIAIMRVIPGMTVLSACDAQEVLPLIRLALLKKGPVYIRLEREPLPNISNQNSKYKIGGSIKLREGKDVTIIAVGGMVWKALEAAEALEKDGIKSSVINMYSIKPIDQETIIAAAKETKCIVTAEDHNRYGGLAGAVAEVIVQSIPIPMEVVAVNDTFAESGDARQLSIKYHLSSQDIVQAVKRVIKKK